MGITDEIIGKFEKQAQERLKNIIESGDNEKKLYDNFREGIRESIHDNLREIGTVNCLEKMRAYVNTQSTYYERLLGKLQKDVKDEDILDEIMNQFRLFGYGVGYVIAGIKYVIVDSFALSRQKDELTNIYKESFVYIKNHKYIKIFKGIILEEYELIIKNNLKHITPEKKMWLDEIFKDYA